MKIVAISDLHGNLIDLTGYIGDVLCICGDIVPLRMQNNIPQCISWIKKTFIPWAESAPVNDVLLVAGNHDFVFERTPVNEIKSLFIGTKVHYLIDEGINIDNVLFYGTPWCHQFGNWAFMTEPETQVELFKKIPNNVDILLTHDAPYGVSDVCFQSTPWNNGEHIGNPELLDAVIRTSPKYMLHGHLHSTNHGVEELNATKVYNVSILDESYKVTYEPFEFKYE